MRRSRVPLALHRAAQPTKIKPHVLPSFLPQEGGDQLYPGARGCAWHTAHAHSLGLPGEAGGSAGWCWAASCRLLLGVLIVSTESLQGPTLWRSLSIFKTLCELNRVWLWAVGAEESRKPRLPGIPVLGVGGDGGGQRWG